MFLARQAEKVGQQPFWPRVPFGHAERSPAGTQTRALGRLGPAWALGWPAHGDRGTALGALRVRPFDNSLGRANCSAKLARGRANPLAMSSSVELATRPLSRALAGVFSRPQRPWAEQMARPRAMSSTNQAAEAASRPLRPAPTKYLGQQATWPC